MLATLDIYSAFLRGVLGRGRGFTVCAKVKQRPCRRTVYTKVSQARYANVIDVKFRIITSRTRRANTRGIRFRSKVAEIDCVSRAGEKKERLVITLFVAR